jgi:hypothetical protein
MQLDLDKYGVHSKCRYAAVRRCPALIPCGPAERNHHPRTRTRSGTDDGTGVFQNDFILTSQGAESAMNAALKNKIRCVEPFAMLRIIAATDCSKFYRMKTDAVNWEGPVPSRTEEIIADLITKSENTKALLTFLAPIRQNGAFVVSEIRV